MFILTYLFVHVVSIVIVHVNLKLFILWSKFYLFLNVYSLHLGNFVKMSADLMLHTMYM